MDGAGQLALLQSEVGLERCASPAVRLDGQVPRELYSGLGRTGIASHFFDAVCVGHISDPPSTK